MASIGLARGEFARVKLCPGRVFLRRFLRKKGPPPRILCVDKIANFPASICSIYQQAGSKPAPEECIKRWYLLFSIAENDNIIGNNNVNMFYFFNHALSNVLRKKLWYAMKKLLYVYCASRVFIPWKRQEFDMEFYWNSKFLKHCYFDNFAFINNQ